MTLTELHYIIAVADEKHFGRAALNVSSVSLPCPSAWATRRLGVTLFERSKAGVRCSS